MGGSRVRDRGVGECEGESFVYIICNNNNNNTTQR